MAGMASAKGRRQRSGVAGNQFLGVRLSSPSFNKLDYAADANGISKAAIVDWMVAQLLELDEDGRLIGWSGALPRDQEELPLTQSA
jgi:hypothetical protein